MRETLKGLGLLAVVLLLFASGSESFANVMLAAIASTSHIISAVISFIFEGIGRVACGFILLAAIVALGEGLKRAARWAAYWALTGLARVEAKVIRRPRRRARHFQTAT